MKHIKAASAEKRHMNDSDFINLTPENLGEEHLCCIIRKKAHIGNDAKKKWLAERLPEGHVFRKLNAKATVFIEYAPLETAWVPIEGDNRYYIYCLWVTGEYKGRGYGRALMEYCIADAKAKGKSGICMLGAIKQKAWLTSQSFAEKFGFKIADVTESGYELLDLSFDGSKPCFSKNVKKESIGSEKLTVFYDVQCPYVLQNIGILMQYCSENGIEADFIEVDSLQKAKELPCVFNNRAVFYKGRFRTVNLLPDVESLKRILKNN